MRWWIILATIVSTVAIGTVYLEQRKALACRDAGGRYLVTVSLAGYALDGLCFKSANWEIIK